MAQRGPRQKSNRERARDIKFNEIVEDMALAMSTANMEFLAERRTITGRMADVLESFYDWAAQYK